MLRGIRVPAKVPLRVEFRGIRVPSKVLLRGYYGTCCFIAVFEAGVFGVPPSSKPTNPSPYVVQICISFSGFLP